MCFCYNIVKNELALSCKEIIYIITFLRSVELLKKIKPRPFSSKLKRAGKLKHRENVFLRNNSASSTQKPLRFKQPITKTPEHKRTVVFFNCISATVQIWTSLMALWPFPIIKVLHVNVKKEFFGSLDSHLETQLWIIFSHNFSYLDTWDIISFEMIFGWFMILFDKKVDRFLKGKLEIRTKGNTAAFLEHS